MQVTIILTIADFVSLQVMSTTRNLTVLVSNTTVGRYHCRATTSGLGEVNAEASVTMRGKPVIDSPLVQYGTLSETARLECVAKSVPVADRIVWTFHNTEIGTKYDQKHYLVSISIYNLSNIVRHVLIICHFTCCEK